MFKSASLDVEKVRLKDGQLNNITNDELDKNKGRKIFRPYGPLQPQYLMKKTNDEKTFLICCAVVRYVLYNWRQYCEALQLQRDVFFRKSRCNPLLQKHSFYTAGILFMDNPNKIC